MATVFRASIMLAVFVGGAGAWVYYGPLPDKAQQIADRLVADTQRLIGWAPSGDSSQATKSAPRFDHNLAVPQTTILPSEALPSEGLQAEMEPLLARLRSLGAVEYVLENWGTGGFFRFHCAMPVARNDNLTRQFEAIASDELSAIRQVVEEVVASRSRSRQTLETILATGRQ